MILSRDVNCQIGQVSFMLDSIIRSRFDLCLGAWLLIRKGLWFNHWHKKLRGDSGANVLQMLKGVDPDIKGILSSGYGLQGEV